jgi:hypothetical protein
MPPAAMRNLLAEENIFFDELPSWQRRGIGLFSETDAANPDGPQLRIRCELDLPPVDVYMGMLRDLLAEAGEIPEEN